MTKLYVALDVPNADAAIALVSRLQDTVDGFKIGLELFCSTGPSVVERVRLAAPSAEIFVDLKLHDIPNTVRGAIRSLSSLAVTFTNVHLSGGAKMAEAAADEAQKCASGMRILGVTVLTSHTEDEIRTTWQTASRIPDLVAALAQLSASSGLAGVIASPHEARPLRSAHPAPFIVMTPGIRPSSSSADDQARVSTPRQASDDGVDIIVVGRPITASTDPAAAATSIRSELA